MSYEEFKLFIQSLGFVYERQMMGKESYKLGVFELELRQSFYGAYYEVYQKVQLGVTRHIIKSNARNMNDHELSVFKSILREHKLNDLGI